MPNFSAARTNSASDPTRIFSMTPLRTSPRGSEAYIAEICVDKRRIEIEKDKTESNYYIGSFPLNVNEPDGKWRSDWKGVSQQFLTVLSNF